MSTVLNFKNWRRLNEALETNGSTPADIAALDTIQKVADLGPRRPNRFLPDGKSPAPAETLLTSVGTTSGAATTMGLTTGQPYKTMSFKISADPSDPAQKVSNIKVAFFAQDGILQATVWKNDVLTLSGAVQIINTGSYDQLIAIGDKSQAEYQTVDMNGVWSDYSGFAAPIAAGIAQLLGPDKNGTTGAVLPSISRGKSNILWSKDHSLLNTFVAAERARANTTPTQKP